MSVLYAAGSYAIAFTHAMKAVLRHENCYDIIPKSALYETRLLHSLHNANLHNCQACS